MQILYVEASIGTSEDGTKFREYVYGISRRDGDEEHYQVFVKNLMRPTATITEKKDMVIVRISEHNA